MELQHGFFVTEPEYLVDLEGLILYLAKVINSDYLCLFCDAEKDFKSAEAARQHMIDKGHCFMNIYLLEDFCLYYDFSKVLDTIKEEADEEQHSREKEKEKETQVATNAGKEKPEDEKSSSDELQAELKEKKILDYQKFIESQLVYTASPLLSQFFTAVAYFLSGPLGNFQYANGEASHRPAMAPRSGVLVELTDITH